MWRTQLFLDKHYIAKLMTMLRKEMFDSYFQQLGVFPERQEINYPLLCERMKKEVENYQAVACQEIPSSENMAAAFSRELLVLAKKEIAKIDETEFLAVMIFKIFSELHFDSPDGKHSQKHMEARAVLLDRGYSVELLGEWEQKIKDSLKDSLEEEKEPKET